MGVLAEAEGLAFVGKASRGARWLLLSAWGEASVWGCGPSCLQAALAQSVGFRGTGGSRELGLLVGVPRDREANDAPIPVLCGALLCGALLPGAPPSGILSSIHLQAASYDLTCC